MPIAPNFSSKLEQNWEISFLQCYPNGFLKHTDLCNILQLTAGYHAETGGISFSDMQEFNQAWVLSRMRVEVKRLPKWKDIVTVKTWIKSLENSRSVRCLELYIGDEKIVGSETFWAVINTEKRRPEALALPHEHFEKFEENATEKSFEKIDIQHEMEIIGNHIVKLSDLDIVNHANNVKYLEWCLDSCNSNQIIHNGLKGFEMNFMRELSLGDEAVICRNDSTFVIYHNGKACFALCLF